MKPHRILVVDDDSYIRLFLEETLVGQKYEVEVAKDGEQAWKMLQASPPDLVLSDLKMPKMDGLALLESINTLDDPPGVVLITAYGTVALGRVKSFSISRVHPCSTLFLGDRGQGARTSSCPERSWIPARSPTSFCGWKPIRRRRSSGRCSISTTCRAARWMAWPRASSHGSRLATGRAKRPPSSESGSHGGTGDRGTRRVGLSCDGPQ